MVMFGVCNMGFLLVVALELLGLVVAGGLALPRAVEEAVRLGVRILVQKVVPGRLTFAAHTARAKGRRQRKAILRQGRPHDVSVQIFGGHILRGINLSGHPAGRVRKSHEGEKRAFSAETYLGDWPARAGELECWLSPGEADQTSSEPPSAAPGEEKRDSAGLSEPQDCGEWLARPVSKIWGFTCATEAPMSFE
jgi:hypothetical protein